MPISCRQHTLAHIHQVRVRTLSHRTYVLGPNCVAWPILGQCCLFYMPNRHGKMGATLWLRVKTINSLSPWSICPSSRVKFKPEQGRTCSQLSSTSTSQWSQCTPKRWEDREQVATDVSSEGQDHQMVSCWSSLQLNNRHPLQLCCHPTPRLSGSQVVCHDLKVTFSWLKHSRGDIWILISLYIWKGNLPSLYRVPALPWLTWKLIQHSLLSAVSVIVHQCLKIPKGENFRNNS